MLCSWIVGRGMVVAIGLAAASAAVFASSSFGTTSDPPPPGPGPDGAAQSAPDARADPGGADAGGAPDPFALVPACPASAAPSCAPAACTRRTLHAGTPRAFPFDLATDRGHVYWVAQDESDAGDPYNGTGTARVYRAAKSGGGGVELARDQPLALALALEGEHVYWAVHVGTTSHLRRVRRDGSCSPSCAPPESVAAFPAGVRIKHLRRGGAGVLLALGEGGQLYRVDTGGSPPAKLLETSDYPGFALTNDHLYVGGGAPREIQRVTLANSDVVPSWATMPLRDAGSGAQHIATDCSSLFLQGHPDSTTYFRVSLAGGVVEPLLSTTRGATALAADARYLYVSDHNAGGVFFHDKTGASALSPIAAGNIWRLVTDDEGVYWGEHGTQAPGHIFMMVK